MYTNEDVIHYYNRSEIQYKITWKLDVSLAMHYGYHDETVKKFEHALLRMNQKLIEIANIKKEDKVLDSGCGVGGSSVYMAKHIGCNVTGITITPPQIKSCQNNAERAGVASLCHFEEQDFLNTTYADETFDVIWAIESICHASDTAKFFEEAYRILKPGGRIVFADYSRIENPTEEERQILDNWLNGWAIDDISTLDQYKDYLKAFSNSTFYDISEHIRPSSKRMSNWYYFGYPWQKLRDLIFTNSEQSNANFKAAKYQYVALKKKLWAYLICLAVK